MEFKATPPLAASSHLLTHRSSSAPLAIRSRPQPNTPHFAGRVGANQAQILNPEDPENDELLEKVPDASPWLSLRETFSLKPFSDLNLWRYALAEALGTFALVFITAFAFAHPPSDSLGPYSASGVFGTSAFIGPACAGILNFFLVTMLIYSLAPVTGGHLNPTITFATFFARLITFPRMILYVCSQSIGGILAGLALRSAFGSRDFQVGGCLIDPSLVPLEDFFLLEFLFTLFLLMMAFGVALDPRQANVIGPALAPWCVGVVLMVLTTFSSFTRQGYGGASMNPARCLGIYVGSSFSPWHWVHWVSLQQVKLIQLASIGGGIAHAVAYLFLPVWVKRP